MRKPPGGRLFVGAMDKRQPTQAERCCWLPAGRAPSLRAAVCASRLTIEALVPVPNRSACGGTCSPYDAAVTARMTGTR